MSKHFNSLNKTKIITRTRIYMQNLFILYNLYIIIIYFIYKSVKYDASMQRKSG